MKLGKKFSFQNENFLTFQEVTLEIHDILINLDHSDELGLKIVFEKIYDYIGCEYGIFSFKNEKGVSEISLFGLPSNNQFHKIEIWLDQFSSLKPTILYDIKENFLLQQNPFKEIQIKNLFILPLRFYDFFLGRVAFINTKEKFEEKDVLEIEKLAKSLALGIHDHIFQNYFTLQQNHLEQEIPSFSSFPEKSPHAVVQVNHEGKIIYQNYEWMRISNQISEKDKHFIPKKWKNYLKKVLKMQQSIHFNIDISKRVFSFHFVPLLDKKIINIYGYDITDEILVEQDRLRSKQIEGIAILAGGIAHDFNNILVGITGNVSILQFDQNLTSDQQDILFDIEKAGKRAAQLTSKLLTFSKGGAPIKKPHNITDFVRKIIQENTIFHDIRPQFHFDTNMPLVEYDDLQLVHVFSNILENAIEASQIPIDIDIYISEKQIYQNDNFPLKDGHYAEICIQDNGMGMSAAQLDQLFVPYYTTKEGRSGMGIPLSYSIVARHGGYMKAESEIGVGTKISFYLPIENEHPIQTAEFDFLKDNFEGKIVVVDDDAGILKTCKKFFPYFGFWVETFPDGQDLLDFYHTHPNFFDDVAFVLLDLTIPNKMGGTETIQHLKEIYPEVVGVVMSGYSNDKVIANYQNYGFHAALKKPFNLKSIAELLSHLFL